jgi:hypothetical protein
MDTLHEQVSAIVECGELERRDTWDTFAAIKAAAHRAAGLQPLPEPPAPPATRRPPPRLTESWFC